MNEPMICGPPKDAILNLSVLNRRKVEKVRRFNPQISQMRADWLICGREKEKVPELITTKNAKSGFSHR